MTTRPATPLEVCIGPDDDFWTTKGPATLEERRLLLRRANSYPRLVEALRHLEQAYANKHSPQHREAALIEARTILSNLGESGSSE
jgi:hypothetical protein